jgi:hypothetical protein
VDTLLVVLSGLCGGLVGVLWNGLVTNPWLQRLAARQTAGAALAQRVLAGQVATTLAYATSGALLGLLYWLSWGLVALNGWSWPAYGLAFGALVWAALALPVLALAGLRAALPRPLTALLALEWLATCLAVGLFCALAWQRLR